MLTLTNLSNNSLSLTHGRIAPGESVKRATLGDKEMRYQGRGWLMVTEPAIETADEGAEPAKADPVQPETPTGAEKPEAKNSKKPVK